MRVTLTAGKHITVTRRPARRGRRVPCLSRASRAFPFRAARLMYAGFALACGRSPNVLVGAERLERDDGTIDEARGLYATNFFAAGDFIGLYTGTWGPRARFRGAGRYLVDAGDDWWHVAPPGSRNNSVNHELHAMAAINEPGCNVRTLSSHPPALSPRSSCVFTGGRECLLPVLLLGESHLPVRARRGARGGGARGRAHLARRAHLVALR